jgi:hypothetical protein
MEFVSILDPRSMVCVYLYSYPHIIPLYFLSVLDMNTIASWN